MNLYAAKMLEYQLSDSAPTNKRLILDSNDFKFAAFERNVEGGSSLIQSDLNSVSTNTINQKYTSSY